MAYSSNNNTSRVIGVFTQIMKILWKYFSSASISIVHHLNYGMEELFWDTGAKLDWHIIDSSFVVTRIARLESNTSEDIFSKTWYYDKVLVVEDLREEWYWFRRLFMKKEKANWQEKIVMGGLHNESINISSRVR